MKIKNIKIYITEIGLIASALCTGCSLNSNETKDNYTNTSSSITTTTEDNNDYSSSSVIESNNTDNTINVGKINETESSFIQKKSVINTSFSKTMDVINNTKINCNYSDLFEIDKALQTYNSYKRESTINTNKIINNNQVDKEKLKQTIIKNSNISIDEDILNRCVNIIKNNVDYFIKDNNVDINTLENNLEQLKIKTDTDFAYASYSSSNNTLSVNPKIMDTLSKQKNLSLDETYERIVGHEVNHLLQAETRKHVDDNNCTEWFGPCFKGDILNVNSLYWEWYIEATAEQLIVDKDKYDEPFVYPYEIEALDGLKIATLLNDKDITGLERLSFSNNLDDFYKYFNCNSEYEKKEILEMFYKLNLICKDSFTSTSADFYNYYEKKNGSRLSGEEKDKFLYNVITSVCIDETKIFYKNLITSISNKECKLEDVLHLISIEEDELARLSKVGVKEYDDDYTKFLESYMGIQKSFFEELSIFYGKTSEEIQEIYDKYHISKHQNIELLSPEKSNYYLKEEQERSEYKFYSMNTLQKLNAQNNVKTK